MKTLSWVGILFVAAVLALFAISNRASVTFALWPLPFAVEAPLYLAVLVALLVGLVVGVVLTWMAGHGRRREARRGRRRIRALESELAATQARLPDAAAPGASAPTAGGAAVAPPAKRVA